MSTSPSDGAADAGRGPFVLEAKGLRKSFGGVEVLHGVDVTVLGGSVLALVGENGAGKSTAVKIIAGDYFRDAGEVFVNGQAVEIAGPRDSAELGIQVIYQEFADAPDLDVAENLSLGNLPVNRWGLVNWPEVERSAKEILEALGVEIDVHRPVESLGVAERQILEIARALKRNAKVLILDEPTSALNVEETEALFEFIRRMKDRGVAIVYITHRLDEIGAIADRVQVFRDGWSVAEGPVDDFDRRAIVHAMAGDVLEEVERIQKDAGGHVHTPVALRLSGATIPGEFTGVDLELREGEIVSLFGRLGCGAFSVAESLFGLRRLHQGEMVVGDVAGQPRAPHEAIARGLGFVSADRKQEGMFPSLSVAENLTVSAWAKLTRRGFLLPTEPDRIYTEWKQTLDVRQKGGPEQLIWTLSGGNQQKIVLGRWLVGDSKVLVLAEPTRGVDVGARVELYRVMREFADRGIGIIVVSTDIEEVLRISDEIVVMSEGRVVGTHRGGQVDKAQLTREAGQSVGDVA